ncbi:MAG: cytochrome c-type biogenesis protein CcmH [Asticcacaulis sp.]|nr:cytochrome c-type biogenesis protein CcmH [Asticcacaulis sp.]
MRALRAIRVYSCSFVVPLLLLPLVANADPAKDEARAQALFREVRCVQCQSETIADSNAPIAGDMRREIRASIASGRSDEEIRQTLYRQYGDYVLFRPRLSKANLILWGAPFLIVLGGLGAMLWLTRKQTTSKTYELSVEEDKKLHELMKSDD